VPIKGIFNVLKQLELLEKQGAQCEVSWSDEITITWDDAFFDRIELTPTDASAVEWRISSPQWAHTDSAGEVMLPVEAVPACLQVLALQRPKHMADRSELVELNGGYDPQAEYRAYQDEKSAR
jgi:hypothetical protein